MTRRDDDAPATPTRDAWALVLVLAWVPAPVAVVIGGVMATSFTGDPVETSDAVVGWTVVGVAASVMVLGPVLALWLTRNRMMQVLAVLELLLLPVLLLRFL